VYDDTCIALYRYLPLGNVASEYSYWIFFFLEGNEYSAAVGF